MQRPFFFFLYRRLIDCNTSLIIPASLTTFFRLIFTWLSIYHISQRRVRPLKKTLNDGDSKDRDPWCKELQMETPE